MRTVNLMINIGKWSTSEALNALKVRLAYYYNGFDVYDKNCDEIRIQKIASSPEFVGLVEVN